MRIIWTQYGRPFTAYNLHYNAEENTIDFYNSAKHDSDSIEISKIYSIETAENGKYINVAADLIPGYHVDMDNIIDSEKNTILVLSWHKNSSFVLSLPAFLDTCSKADLNRVLTMIKQFSIAVKDDINKILFSLETILTSAAKKYSKIKEWIFTSKIYQEVFGSSEAEKLAAGDNITLEKMWDTYPNYYSTSKKATFYTYSKDLPTFTKEPSQGYVIKCIVGTFGSVIKSCILTNDYDFVSVENLTTYAMYLLNKSGKIMLEYRIVSYPEAIPDNIDLDNSIQVKDYIFANTVINIRKPKKAAGFDLDTIQEEIKQFWNDRKAQKAAEQEAEAEKAVEPSENVTEAAENPVESPVEFIIDKSDLFKISTRFNSLCFDYVIGSNTNNGIFSPNNYKKMVSECPEVVENWLQLGKRLLQSPIPAAKQLLNYVYNDSLIPRYINNDNWYFDTDNCYLAALIYAIMDIDDYYHTNILDRIIPEQTEEQTEQEAEKTVEYYNFGDYIINIPYLMIIYQNYIDSFINADIDISDTTKSDLLNAADLIINNLSNIPVLSDLWTLLIKAHNDIFTSDNELISLMLAFKGINIFDYIMDMINQKADIMQAAEKAANPSEDLPQKEKPKKAAATKATITTIIYYAVIPVYHTRSTDSFVNMSLKASQNTGARPPNIKPYPHISFISPF